jgi:hypothetical protein
MSRKVTLAAGLRVRRDPDPARDQQVDIPVGGVARDDAIAGLVVAPYALARDRVEPLGRKPFEQLHVAQTETGRLNVS